MKAIKFLFKVFLGLILFLLIIFIPDLIHPYYYKIKYPNHCELYKNKSSQEIIDIFKDKSDYTKYNAEGFFVNCKNKNAVPFIFTLGSNDEVLGKDIKNPLRILPITVVIHGPLFSGLNYALSELLEYKKPDINFYPHKDGKKLFSDYWRPVIKEKLNIDVKPLD